MNSKQSKKFGTGVIVLLITVCFIHLKKQGRRQSEKHISGRHSVE